MRDRKAFTLLELLVVIGIILLLVGLLLPVVNGARRRASLIAGKSDLQTIATALEAYHQDFGDYPRNVQLPRWNTQEATPVAAPINLSLAAALMGPGPAVTQDINSGNGVQEIGDGSDGLGFRNQTMNSTVTVTSDSLASAPYSVTIGSLPTSLNNFVWGQTIASLTLSVGTQYEETIGISGVSANELTLAAAPRFPSNHSTTDTYVVKIATGKVWSSYLPADSFKVAFVPGTDVNDASLSQLGYGEPVLLDRWGQVIQYFPRYGPANNRTYSSVLYPTPPGPNTSLIAGPLYGYSQPASIDTTSGQNSIWDFRDGSPFFTYVTNPSSFASVPQQSDAVLGQQWEPIVRSSPYMGVPATTPGTNTPYYFDPVSVLLWMLGGLDQTTGTVNNYIDTNCKLLYDGPYILISAGPDGPDRPNGGFCSFVYPSSNINATPPIIGGTLMPASSWQQTFNTSGNIYNFDPP